MQATPRATKCLVSMRPDQPGIAVGHERRHYHRELENGGPVWEQGKVWREQNRSATRRTFRTPILLSVGERDFRVPMNQTLENWAVLQRLKIPSG